MYTTLAQYSDIISAQAKALLNSNIIGLNTIQRGAFRTINQHAQKLEYVVDALATLPNGEIPLYISKQLLNVVAPIHSYAELLNREWVGTLSHDQAMHVEIILNCALDLHQRLQKALPPAVV